MMSTYIKFDVNIITKIINLKLEFIKQYKNMKRFLQKDAVLVDLKKFLWSKKLKILRRGHM